MNLQKRKVPQFTYFFSNEVFWGVWSGGPPCRGGISICLRTHITEGADSGNDAEAKTDKATEGDNGVKGRHRFLGILQVPRKLI